MAQYNSTKLDDLVNTITFDITAAATTITTTIATSPG
jgi:hypothetical protein